MAYAFQISRRRNIGDGASRLHALRTNVGPRKLYLHGDAPSWLPKLDLTVEIVIRQGSLFQEANTGVENTDFSLEDHSSALAASPWDWPITMSSPERALLETIDETLNHESFHNLDVLFPSMGNVRPKLMMQLLQMCRSIKTKRLFFVFADWHAHAWRKYIDESAIDLGSGDRMLVEGGKLHKRYRITLPSEFVGTEGHDGA